MGWSRVTLRERFIDAPDGALEVWLGLLVDAIDGTLDSPDWLKEARADWHEVATAEFGFGVIPELDAFILEEEQRRIVLERCETARRHLIDLGDPILASKLNAMDVGSADARFTKDVPAAVFICVADQFIALVRDTPFSYKVGT